MPSQQSENLNVAGSLKLTGIPSLPAIPSPFVVSIPQLDVLLTQISALSAQLEKAVSQLSDAIAAVATAQTAETASLTAAVTRVQTDVTALTANAATLNTQIAALQAQIAAGPPPAPADLAALKALQDTAAANQAKLDGLDPTNPAVLPPAV